MGPLKCQLFQSPPAVRDRLNRCLVSDQDHVTPGSRGEHVAAIQTALNRLSVGPGRENFRLKVDGIYGPKTAAAVKAYKAAKSRDIRQPWQKTPDDIVGKRTIRSLDDEMDILENTLPESTRFVSLTHTGSPHRHDTCPHTGTSFDEHRGMSHFGTPINPQGFGRKITLGGEGELKYLGFVDFMPNPFPMGPQDRPLTKTLPDRCVSDIALRDAPIMKDGSPDKGVAEIKRLAMPSCRLTFCGDVPQFRAQLMQLGPIIEDIFVSVDPRFKTPTTTEIVVLIVR